MRMFLLGGTLPALSSLVIACSAAQPTVPPSPPASKVAQKVSTVASPAVPPAPRANPARELSQLKAQLRYDDRVVAMRSLHVALTQVPDGGTFVWQKEGRALKGVIRPGKSFRNTSGQVCRHVIYALALGAYKKRVEGVACRQNDGSWQF